KRVAAIPFMRNLIEYTSGDEDPDYGTLTSLLHWRSDSNSITQKDLDAVYHRLFGQDGEYGNADQLVVDAIDAAAKACLAVHEGVNFQNKIVLAIAIRLTAERYMVRRIGDQPFVSGIKAN